MKRNLLALFGLMVLLPTWGLARDIHVNNVIGSDLNDGQRPVLDTEGNGPVRTLAKAVRMATGTDRIVIANTGEPYRESVSISGTRFDGMPEFPFVIEGNGAVFDGLQPVPYDGWTPVGGGVFKFEPINKTHPRLYRDGVPLEYVEANDQQQRPVLAPLQWCQWNREIYFRVEPFTPIETYNLAQPGLRSAILLYKVRNVRVQNLVIRGYWLGGIVAPDDAMGCEVRACELRDNARCGLYVGGASRVLLLRSIVQDNLDAQVLISGYSGLTIAASDLAGGPGEPVVEEQFFGEVVERE